MDKKMFRLVSKVRKKALSLFLTVFMCICLTQANLAASAVTLTTVNQDTVEFEVKTTRRAFKEGKISQTSLTLKSRFGNYSHVFKIPADLATNPRYIEDQVELLCSNTPIEQQQKAKLCTRFLLHLAALGQDQAKTEFEKYIATWKIGTPLISESTSGDIVDSFRDYQLADYEEPEITPENMLDINENPSEDPTSIYEIFHFAQSHKTSAAPQSPLASSSVQSLLSARLDETKFQELRASTLELEERLIGCERRMGLESEERHRLEEQNRQLQQEIAQLKDQSQQKICQLENQDARLQQEASRLESQSASLHQRIEQLEARIAQLSTAPAPASPIKPAPASTPASASPVKPAPAPPPAPSPVLKQKNGQPITAPGQLVDFVGTCSFSGQGTPPEHQQDQTDTYMVMKIEGKRALIMKQNPITVQKYKAGGSEARYDQSDLKASVASWYSTVASKRIGGFLVSDFALPVKLNGESQSSPFGRNANDQIIYRTEVDPQSPIRAFVPSLFDVKTKYDDNYPDVGQSTWTSIFVSGFSNSGNQYSQITWLRSPFYFSRCATYVTGVGDVGYYSVGSYSLALHPAFYINI